LLYWGEFANGGLVIFGFLGYLGFHSGCEGLLLYWGEFANGGLVIFGFLGYLGFL